LLLICTADKQDGEQANVPVRNTEEALEVIEPDEVVIHEDDVNHRIQQEVSTYCAFIAFMCLQCFDAGFGGRKGIRPVKNSVVGCWRGYVSGVRCRLAYGPADATATHCLLLQ